MKAILLFFFVFTSYAKTEISNDSTKIQLLELFSTQSCSSCPPAQKWVSELQNESELYKTFVPVVYHVDYWDYLGWKDPYSKKEYSDYQRSYSAKWNSKTIYTPMFVLDGGEWRARSRNTLKKTLTSKIKLVVKFLGGNKFEVRANNIKPNLYTLHSALMINDVKTKVRAGENRGRILKQDFYCC